MSKKSEIIDSMAECQTGNEVLKKIDLIIEEMNSNNFPVMSASEEAGYIIQDVFDGDVELEQSYMQKFCDSHSVTYSPKNKAEIDDLIIDYEDELYAMVLVPDQQEESAVLA